MAKETQEILEFGPFRLDAGEALLTRQGTPVSLPPKVFDLLVYLSCNAGRLIEKDELLKALWPDSFVEESNLTVNIAALCRALGAQEDGQAWIETVPKRGYRFIGIVTHPAPTAALSAPSTEAIPAPLPQDRKYLIGAIVVLVAAGALIDFRRPRPPAPASPQQSIAILPFVELSTGGGGDEHAGLGMTDALITKLGGLPELTVRSLGTVRKYEGSNIDPLDAGRALKADTVLAGSVQRLDKRIRVSVRLLRVRNGQSLWADKFDEFFTNLFAVQDAISEKLARVLALRLTSEDQDRMMRRFTESTEAFRLFELGRYERHVSLGKSIEYYKRSIQEDSRYALPYVELLDIHLGLAGNGSGAFERNAPLARQYADKALRLAPDLAEAHVANGDLKRVVERDFEGAGREIDKALQLNPRCAKAHDSRGILLAVTGNPQGAIQEERTATVQDPFNVIYAENLAWALYCARQYQAAVDVLDEFAQRDSGPRTDWSRFYAEVKLGRIPEAIALMEASMKASGSNDPKRAALAQAYAAGGQTGEAQRLLKGLAPDWGFYQRAVVELALGDREAALTHLERSVDEHSVWIEWIKVDPNLEALHGDPRYVKIVQRVGLKP